VINELPNEVEVSFDSEEERIEMKPPIKELVPQPDSGGIF